MGASPAHAGSTRSFHRDRAIILVSAYRLLRSPCTSSFEVYLRKSTQRDQRLDTALEGIEAVHDLHVWNLEQTRWR